MVLYTLASPQNLKYDSESGCIAAQHMLGAMHRPVTAATSANSHCVSHGCSDTRVRVTVLQECRFRLQRWSVSPSLIP